MFLLLALFFHSIITSAQIATDYFILLSATMENQVSGANAENSSRTIYNVTLEAKAGYYIKTISGRVNGAKLMGEIIYKNAISDSASIGKGETFILRFQKANAAGNIPGIKNVAVINRKKCHRGGKNSIDNAVIFLSFFIENNRYSFPVTCSQKVIEGERQLPQ